MVGLGFGLCRLEVPVAGRMLVEKALNQIADLRPRAAHSRVKRAIAINLIFSGGPGRRDLVSRHRAVMRQSIAGLGGARGNRWHHL